MSRGKQTEVALQSGTKADCIDDELAIDEDIAIQSQLVTETIVV